MGCPYQLCSFDYGRFDDTGVDGEANLFDMNKTGTWQFVDHTGF